MALTLTRMMWEKIRREKLCMTHGTAGMEEELVSSRSLDQHKVERRRQTITVGDPAAGMRHSGLFREFRDAVPSKPKPLTAFGFLVTLCNNEALMNLSDADLKEGRAICESLNRRLREQQFERKRQNPYR